jgi:hypothetical protein
MGEIDRVEFCESVDSCHHLFTCRSRLRIFGFNLRPEFERNLCDSLCSARGSKLIDYVSFISSLQSSMRYPFPVILFLCNFFSEEDDLDEVLTVLRENIKNKLAQGNNLSEVVLRELPTI